jgi:hypothetical protein
MNYLTLFLWVAITLLNTTPIYARQNSEKYYQELWCLDKGETGYILPDRSKVDCLTDTHAIEVNFADTYKDAIGQAIYNSRITGKKPGILIIIEKDSDYKYLPSLGADLRHIKLKDKIKVWTIKP